VNLNIPQKVIDGFRAIGQGPIAMVPTGWKSLTSGVCGLAEGWRKAGWNVGADGVVGRWSMGGFCKTW